MGLKLELETLEGLPEEQHALYSEKEDKSGFTLQVEGLPDVGGLKKALDTERTNVKDLKKQLGTFKDVDPDKYQNLLSREADLEKADPTKIEELVQARIQKNNQSWETKFGEVEQKLSEKDQRLASLLITDELRKVGGELGVQEGEPMNDFIARGRSVFRLHEDKVVPMVDNEIVYGESGVEALTMREFGKKLSATASHLFKPSGGGGADNAGGGNTGSGTVRTKADFRTAADKAKYIGEHGRDAYLALPSAPAQKAS